MARRDNNSGQPLATSSSGQGIGDTDVFQTGALLTGGEIEYPGRVPGKTRDIKRRHKIKVEQRGFIVRKITIFVNTAI